MLGRFGESRGTVKCLAAATLLVDVAAETVASCLNWHGAVETASAAVGGDLCQSLAQCTVHPRTYSGLVFDDALSASRLRIGRNANHLRYEGA